MSEDIEIECEVLRETEAAYLIHDGNTEAWIPKSQISDISEGLGQITSIFIPEWLAEKNDLL
jgi:hypothetical protein